MAATGYEIRLSGPAPLRWRVGSHRRSVAVHLMNRRMRSYGYALATMLLALVLAWAGRVTWLQLRQLHRSFNSLQEDAFHLSEYIDASFDDISDIALRFDPRDHPEDRAEFQNKTRDFQQWLREHRPAVTTPQEGELMDQIAAAFELYVSQTTNWMDARARAGTTAATATTRERMDTNAIPILNLCGRLKAVEHDAQARFLEESRRALGLVAGIAGRANGPAGFPARNGCGGGISRGDRPAARRAGGKPRPRRAAREAGVARHAGRRRRP